VRVARRTADHGTRKTYMRRQRPGRNRAGPRQPPR
jgi:hypothetical protein